MMKPFQAEEDFVIMKKMFLGTLTILLALCLAGCEYFGSDGFTYDSLYEQGHPKFNDTIEKAEAFKQKYSKSVNVNQKIVTPNVLIISSNDDLITSLEIDFWTVDCRNWNDVIRATKEYLPFENINAYYQKKEAFIITPNPREGKPRTPPQTYCCIWELTEKGKQSLTEGAFQGSELISVQISTTTEHGYFSYIDSVYPDWTLTAVNFDKTYTRTDWDINWDEIS